MGSVARGAVWVARRIELVVRGAGSVARRALRLVRRAVCVTHGEWSAERRAERPWRVVRQGVACAEWAVQGEVQVARSAASMVGRVRSSVISSYKTPPNAELLSRPYTFLTGGAGSAAGAIRGVRPLVW